MKKASIYLFIVVLLIAGITASVLYSRWQQEEKAKQDARNFRKAERALDEVFKLPSDMRRQPPSKPKEP